MSKTTYISIFTIYYICFSVVLLQAAARAYDLRAALMPEIYAQELHFVAADTSGGLQYHLQRLPGISFTVSRITEALFAQNSIQMVGKSVSFFPTFNPIIFFFFFIIQQLPQIAAGLPQQADIQRSVGDEGHSGSGA